MKCCRIKRVGRHAGRLSAAAEKDISPGTINPHFVRQNLLEFSKPAGVPAQVVPAGRHREITE